MGFSTIFICLSIVYSFEKVFEYNSPKNLFYLRNKDQHWSGFSLHFWLRLRDLWNNWIIISRKVHVTYFWQIFPFYTHWNNKKTSGFLVFSEGDAKREN